LGTGRDLAVDDEVSEKGFDFQSTPGLGVADVVAVKGASDPVDLGLLGAKGEVAHTTRFADLVEELHGHSPCL
jgi:hypothetical protein